MSVLVLCELAKNAEIHLSVGKQLLAQTQY